MSDLFRSALGYLSNTVGPPSAGGGNHQGGGYSSAPGGPSDDTNAVGEVIAFNFQEQKRNVRIVKLIAEGGFSYVFRGVDLQSGDSVAVKKILASDPEAVKGVEQEIEFMRQFQHEHIVKFYGSFMKSSAKNLQEHYLGMEFCPVPLPTPPFRLQHTTQIFAQTCRAIKYLHEFGIVHRDIKLENLLVGVDGLIKLVDFGSATMDKIYPLPEWSMNKRTIVEEQIAAKTTPMYRAPEMLDLWSNYPIDEHVDLWALGCLLFALNFGQHPFQDSNKLAIVNANYSLPKNVSDSGPVVSLIRGLLKVSPVERHSFGQILEILVSIAESQNFSLNGPLPFKAASSPNLTGEPLGGESGGGGGGGGGGIVNPLSSIVNPPAGHIHQQPFPQSHQQPSSGGGGSLFSSLKGGAAILIKNIKEQSQQYLGAPGSGGAVPPVGSTSSSNVPPSHPLPPNRPPGPNSNSSAGAGLTKPPPPRPAPPSPLTQKRESASHIEFENREYEEMQRHKAHPPNRPAPPKPPPPAIVRREEPFKPEPESVANLLDIGFDNQESSNSSSQQNSAQASSNADLLGDLFGSSNAGMKIGNASSGGISDDLFWVGGGGSSNTIGSSNRDNNGGGSDLGDLMGDPFASIMGKSAPSSRPNIGTGSVPSGGGFANFASSQPLLQPSAMPSSASFQNLNAPASGLVPGSGQLETGSSRIPKNSSSPNLLSDLIMDDLMSVGSGVGKMSIGQTSTASMNKSNPTINNDVAFKNNPQTSTSIPPPCAAANQRPNYNRNQIFDPPTASQQGKQTLNDVFGDILNSQGFATSGKDLTGKTINDLRKSEMHSNPNLNPTQIKINDWREGKKKNIRALLASLHTVTWDECHWEEANMSQMITPAQVKKMYRKACLAVHPDKQMGQDWEDLAKMIFVELNEAWAAFEDSQT